MREREGTEAHAFGDLLRTLRGRAGLTQEELAERAGLSAKAIGALERGDRRRPRPATLRALAAALGLSRAEHEAFLSDASTGVPPGMEALPVERVPAPGPLPPTSRMPFVRSPLFTGRLRYLRAIAAAFRSGAWAARLGQVIGATGMGGVGKTHLAAEFVHRYGRYFAGGVFWLSFASPEEIPLEVAACGGHGFLALREDFATLGLNTRLALVRGAWERETPRLLVFDNCEDPSLLAQWRPASGGCRILVTSRRARWAASLGVECLDVDVMERGESVELLRRFRPDISEQDLHAIAEQVADLPLALHLAGSFLHRYPTEIGPGDYLAQLRAPGVIDHASLLGLGLGAATSPTGHVQSVAQTFAMSYARLDVAGDIDAMAVALLARMACFAPGEPVPRDLLLTTLAGPTDLDSRLRRSDALARTAELGLVHTSGDGVRLHRLVAHFVRRACPDSAAGAAVQESLIAAGRAAVERESALPTLLAVITHLRHVAATPDQDDERAAALREALGRALGAAGDFRAARAPLEQALDMRERVLGPDHPATASSVHDLAGLLSEQGSLAAARKLFERALVTRERTLGADHPDAAATLHDLAHVVQDLGDLTAARRLFERAVSIRERALGEDDPRTALSVNELAFLLKEQGELAAARPLFERALATLERTAGPDHPATASSLNDLGLLLRDMGEYEAGRPLLERAVDIRTLALGPNHVLTASALNNLGALVRAQGDPATALELFQRALAIRERVLGLDHPHTAQSLNNVAGPLQDMGRTDEALALFERSLAIRERVLGPDHVDTGASLNNPGLPPA
jgi:tetratricopeptide (TPR) repeat protein/transcriptional regulator with XRE-family HTH domain